jgi:hypothetical protein
MIEAQLGRCLAAWHEEATGVPSPGNKAHYFPSHFGGRFSENAFGPSI